MSVVSKGVYSKGAGSKSAGALFLLAMIAAPASGSASAQEWAERPAQAQANSNEDVAVTVYGKAEGPKIEGIISALSEDRLRITSAGGVNSVITYDETTEIKVSGGFLGLGGKKAGADSLLTGLPVTVETERWGMELVASEIRFKKDDLHMASMIRNGTAQRFAEHDAAIAKNSAANEALRSRMGDLDKYDVKGTTNVYFDSGKWMLSAQAERDLCAAASVADSLDNALLLVVGYTDSTGSYEVNQELSERRAGRVVNYLQQACGWKPYRMLTPAGMAAADPQGSNDTVEGKAQNRRVAVNILVSKASQGL